MDKTLKQIKGLLFDKDGTLINLTQTWLQPIRECAQLVANAAGQPSLTEQLLADGGYQADTDDWSQDSILAYGTNEQMLDLWAKRAGHAAVDEVKHLFSPITRKASWHAVPVVQPFKPLLAQLSQHYTLGVASMDSEGGINATLEGLDAMSYFKFLCGADSGFGVKPSGGMTTAFCKAMQLEPNQVVVVGDSMHDINMAHDAGAIAIGVLSGGHKRSEFEQAAEYVLDDISQLPALFNL